MLLQQILGEDDAPGADVPVAIFAFPPLVGTNRSAPATRRPAAVVAVTTNSFAGVVVGFRWLAVVGSCGFGKVQRLNLFTAQIALR